ncbi:MAG: hypothetical protein Q7J29_04945 [Stagnimonas sp.]|nr:hypothetical protein [Stagnimonas sp.]
MSRRWQKEAVSGVAYAFAFLLALLLVVTLIIEVWVYATYTDKDLIDAAVEDVGSFSKRIGLQSEIAHAELVGSNESHFSRMIVVTDQDNRCFEVTVHFFLYDVRTTTGALSATSRDACIKLIEQQRSPDEFGASDLPIANLAWSNSLTFAHAEVVQPLVSTLRFAHQG